MAERSMMFEGVQVGVEVTPGTGVAANKKLLATSFEVGPEVDITAFKPNGYKYNTITSLNTEWTEGSINGIMSYTDLTYLLSSLISADTPATVGTTGKEWVFVSDSDGPDAPVTFTIEQGSSVRAHKFTHGMVSGLTLSFSNDGCEVDGTIVGRALTDGITMTVTPTEVDIQPVTRPQVTLEVADTAAGLTAATVLTRGFAIDWSLTDRYSPILALNGLTDWDAYIEAEPTGEITLLMEADAAGMAYLTNMRTGATKFIRIVATGPVIGAGPATYKLTIDTACKVTDASEFQNDQDVVAMEWTFSFAHDVTWGKSFNISLINALASL